MSQGFYENRVEAASRSRMSIPFRVTGGSSRSPAEASRLEASFLAEAEAAGFRSIMGHPLHGGMRASLYHGVENESVAALAALMARFERAHA